jgi:hypothetical protein
MTPPSIAFAIVLLSLTLVNAHLIFPKDFSTTSSHSSFMFKNVFRSPDRHVTLFYQTLMS